MTDDLVARLRYEQELCAVMGDTKAGALVGEATTRIRELEDRIGVLERDLDAQSAGHRLFANEATEHLMRVRELEAELARTREELGGTQLVLEQTERNAERAIAGAYERAANVAETEGVYSEMNVHGGGPGWYRHGLRIAAAIRKLAQEVKHEAE